MRSDDSKREKLRAPLECTRSQLYGANFLHPAIELDILSLATDVPRVHCELNYACVFYFPSLAPSLRAAIKSMGHHLILNGMATERTSFLIRESTMK